MTKKQDRRPTLRQLCWTALAAWCGLTAGVAIAQTQTAAPGSVLRFIVPVGPGSSADTSTRFIAERVGKIMGLPAIVENKPGADFVIGVQALLAAPPDGRTLMMISQTSMVINPIINKTLPYDPQRDIRPLVASNGSMSVLVTGASSKYRIVADVVDASRKQPNSVSLGYYAQFYRMNGSLMEEMGKIQFTQVPYKGAAQQISDLVGGNVDIAFIDVGTALPLVKSGRLRALAVSGKARSGDLPDVPTLDQSGFAGFDLFIWVGYGVSTKVPQAQADALQAALAKVMEDPEFRAFSAQNGNLVVLGTPGKELAARIANETARFRPLLEAGERNR